MSGDNSPPRIAVLISGRGSNMRALAEQSLAATPSYRVALVLSDKPGAAGIGIARDLGITAQAVATDHSGTRADYDRRLAAVIDEYSPALIVLAGFMRILSTEFVDRYAGRIMNIHPSLLPKYPGLHTHRRVLEAQDAYHGATVHFVTAELDGGPRVIQARIAVRPQDDEHTLAARVLGLEHRIYPQAVAWYCEDRLRCRGGQAWLDGQPLDEPLLWDGLATFLAHPVPRPAAPASSRRD